MASITSIQQLTYDFLTQHTNDLPTDLTFKQLSEHEQINPKVLNFLKIFTESDKPILEIVKNKLYKLLDQLMITSYHNMLTELNRKLKESEYNDLCNRIHSPMSAINSLYYNSCIHKQPLDKYQKDRESQIKLNLDKVLNSMEKNGLGELNKLIDEVMKE